MKNPSSLIYGCMGLGEWNRNPISNKERSDAFASIEAALENRITTFDLADIYTYGKAEKLLGSYLKEHPEWRDKVYIQSKAGIVLHPSNTGSNRYNLGIEYLDHQIDESLKNLGVDHLDGFLMHRYDPLVNPAQLGLTLNNLRHSGRVRDIGLSNIPPTFFNQLQDHCNFQLKHVQIQLSLGQSKLLQPNTFFNLNGNGGYHQASLSDYFLSDEVEIQAWGALDKGAFLNSEAIASGNKTALVLGRIAEERDTSPEAIQLAWLLKLPYFIRPIIGSSQPERIARAAACCSVELSHEEWYDLWVSTLGSTLP